jgi:hypothetical protein
MQPEFDKLVLGEVLAQFVIHRVIDGEMIGCEEFGETQRSSLNGGKVFRFGGSFQ